MSDMSHLYRAYAAVHNTEVKTELTEARNEISKMNLGQLTDADLVLVAEEVIAGFFKQDYTAAATHEWICCSLEESVAPNSSPLRKDKVRRLAEAFDTAFEKVYERAVDVCEESFLHYMNSKPLVEKWQGRVSHEQGNQKIHNSVIAKDRQGVLEGLIKMVEGVRDLDPEKGTKERKERLEKKRGMKLDDHPQYKAEEFQASTIRKEWASAYKGIYEAKKGDGNLANNYPPYDKVTRGDVIAGAKGEDQMGGKKKKPVKEGTMDIKGFEIPKKERDAAAKRIAAKTAKKQSSLKKEEFVNEVSSHLALTASQKADEERRKAAVAGDTSRAASKAAQASRLYKGVGPRKTRERMKEEVQKIDELVNPKVNLPFSGDKITYNQGGGAGAALGGAAAAGLGALTGYGLSKMGKKKEEKKDEVKKEGVQFSAEELARIEAIVNSWDEGYQREPDQAGKKDRTHSKQPDPSKPGFTGVGNMSIAQIAKMSKEIEKKQK